MIENTFGNKALEKKEGLEDIVESIQILKSEIVNGIEEMGGEEEFNAKLYEDNKLAEKQKILKENILKIIYALVAIGTGSAFGYKAVAQAEGIDYLERLKSMATLESVFAMFSFLIALMATFSIKEEDKSENLDQL